MARFCFLILLSVLSLVCAPVYAEELTLRVGFFPNVTHAHALVAQSMAAEGNGWFEQRIPGLRLHWQSFNAGPSAMESLFAKAVDITYVGPSPALNAFIRSAGKDIRVVSGAVRGGSGLVVPQNSTLALPADFKGKKIATPQLGNTQDVACRSWLTDAGLQVRLNGGDVFVIPTANPDQLPLFLAGHVDGAWTVEPWLSRLEMQANARLIYLDPPATSITTIVVSSHRFLETHPELLKQFVQAHTELTLWINEHPEEAQKRVAEQLTRITRRTFPLDLVKHAWPRLVFENNIALEEFAFSLKAAQKAGFLNGEHDLAGLVQFP